jgi:hypothetical protein
MEGRSEGTIGGKEPVGFKVTIVHMNELIFRSAYAVAVGGEENCLPRVEDIAEHKRRVSSWVR